MNKKATICSIVGGVTLGIAVAVGGDYVASTMNELMENSQSTSAIIQFISTYGGLTAGALLGSTGGYLTGKLIFKEDEK